MLNKPILSVVVPTHNRSQYALSCIEAVLSLDDPSVQLVVSDTSTDGKLRELLRDGSNGFIHDARLKYVNVEEPSNLTKNHNDALALADGEYVCLIGDDDCITRAAPEAARWASDNEVLVVSQTIASAYAWPDFQSRFTKGLHAARLYVPRAPGGARWRSGAADLVEGLQRSFQGTDRLPRCYHGVVRRDLLEELRGRTGSYFHGSSPDMSGAVGLACLVERYCEVDIPLTISGASGGSNSGRSAMNTHKGELSSESQTRGFQESGWSSGVPRFFSVETVWAHAGLSCLEKLRPDLIPCFNFAHLLALCRVRHPEFGRAIENATQELRAAFERDIAPSILRAVRRERRASLGRLFRRATNLILSGQRCYSRVPDIAAASRCYEAYAKRHDFSFIEVADRFLHVK